MPDEEQPGRLLSLNMGEVMDKGPELSPGGPEALRRLREFLAPEEKIGWWIVYNGDPKRAFPTPEANGGDNSSEQEGSEDDESKETSE
ncbi:conserved hypothetical protein [Uncinocarpus reesii 1704]|uniref:Uncharacterized protein n=1 Tax=Uncinocarpus reesii (strain UAMH 1704) TaxID=336963 RepID=C4JYE2_UNCRE|nr:uncharacterized protein UREG_07193 [Uncinocarpus reesii 1704]EEP82328.1 conserved hypothetical protein [Uncinocarpus reesii 1704]